MKNRKPPPVKLKPIIKANIKLFLGMFRPGDMLRSEDIVSYCRRMTGKKMYPDTVLRYCRELRQDGVINYSCTSKMDRVFKILAPGEPHSR
jgi:hypothetical protein